MQKVNVDFVQRLKLNNLLSSQEGTLGKIAPFMRVMEKIRFTEEEEPQITKTPVSDTIVNFSPPNSEFGKITVEIENSDAVAIAALMEDWPHFTTADHTWAARLLKELKP